MGKSRFTEERKLRIVREHSAGADMTVLCRRHGVSPSTLYDWRRRHAGMPVAGVERMPVLEATASGLRRDLERSERERAALESFPLKLDWLLPPGGDGVLMFGFTLPLNGRIAGCGSLFFFECGDRGSNGVRASARGAW